MNQKKHLDNSVTSSISSYTAEATRVIAVADTNANEPAMLSMISGPKKWMGHAWSLIESQTLGRDRNKADILIPELSLSRKHVLLLCEGNEIKVQDLHSTNGTFLNGKRLDPKLTYSLKNNDILKMGQLVFKFIEKGNVEGRSILNMQKQIYTDELCKIHNRMFMEIRARELFTASKREDLHLSFIVFDIDFFKKVNDTYSHLAGDDILRSVSDLVSKLIRKDDIFCRIGGEEFGLILPCRLESARRLIEKVRKCIEDKVFTFKKQEIKITISAGATSLQPSDHNWKNLYERADKALYESKENGRNRTTVHHS